MPFALAQLMPLREGAGVPFFEDLVILSRGWAQPRLAT